MPVTVTHVVSRDDGGYINIGTQGNLGSQFATLTGKTFCFWLRTVDANNIIPMGFNWFAYDGIGSSGYALFQINSKWTTDYTGEANSVNYYPPSNSTAWAYWKATGVDFNDSQYHHHCIAWTGSLTTPTVNYYVDGVITGGAWNDYSDGPVVARGNLTADNYIGCTQKTVSNTLQDFASFRLADYRIYDRCLSGAEIFQIFKQRGRDTIRRGLHARYPFQGSTINMGSYRTSAILANDAGVTPTYNNDRVLRGVRRKVM